MDAICLGPDRPCVPLPGGFCYISDVCTESIEIPIIRSFHAVDEQVIFSLSELKRDKNVESVTPCDLLRLKQRSLVLSLSHNPIIEEHMSYMQNHVRHFDVFFHLTQYHKHWWIGFSDPSVARYERDLRNL